MSYCDVRFRPAPDLGIRYSSGRFIYDEAFIEGRLVGRYWSTTGVIRPEMHFRRDDWTKAVRHMPADAFILAIEGEELKGGWHWIGAEETDASGFRNESGLERHIAVHLSHERRPIEVRVHTRIDGSPFMIRWLEVSNLGDNPSAISAVFPWTGMIWCHRHASEFVAKEYPTPFVLGYNRHFLWGTEGDFGWEPLQEGTNVLDSGRLGRSGHRRPAFVLQNIANGEYLIGELGWSGNWLMRFDCQLVGGGASLQQPVPVPLLTPAELRRVLYDKALSFRIGPVAADQAMRVLEPGETVKTPAVHLALMHTDFDTCVQALHNHLRNVVLPKEHRQPLGDAYLVEANHRGYICDHEDEEGLKREIDIAAEFGCELFMVDAGWYGPEPNRWWNNVGDWYEGAWLPNGLEPVREHARKKGMKFGLWAEIECIGEASKLRKQHPDWVLTRNGEPVGRNETTYSSRGRALDLSKPEVVAWIESEIVRLIRQYDLDMFRLDYNTFVGEGGNHEKSGFIENTLWRHCEAVYGIFDRVRRQFPNVIFQNCAAGGGRLDLEILRRFQNTEISDWARGPRNIKILYGVTMALPPEICLRTFGTEVAEFALEGDVDFQLRVACLSLPIFRGISPTLDEMNPDLRARIIHHIELYKNFIRPLLPTCRVFHHTGTLPLVEATPWAVLEYASQDATRAVAGVFRTADVGEPTYVFKPHGLNRAKDYRVTFDNTREAVRVAGLQLARDGIEVNLQGNLTSELLLIEGI